MRGGGGGGRREKGNGRIKRTKRGGKKATLFLLDGRSLGRRRRGSRRGGPLLHPAADGRADDGRGVAGARGRVEEAEAVGFLFIYLEKK